MPGQLLPGLARALTWAGEPWNRKRARMPAPKGTLDTLVNGPEGLPLFDGDAWEHVDWRHHEEQVRRLRGRIFQAVRDGDWSRARSLQKLALRSWSNTLVSVRQVTQRNTGRRTAGIDGLVALTSQARAEMAVRVHVGIGSHRPSPVRRVYIPKASDKTKMRPLGIPLLIDRCHQARVKNALEPEWEARFEPRSYGFRPSRRISSRARMGSARTGARRTRSPRSTISHPSPLITGGFWRPTSKPAWMHGHTAPLLIVMIRTAGLGVWEALYAGLSCVRCG